jgi:hypothetical protein
MNRIYRNGFPARSGCVKSPALFLLAHFHAFGARVFGVSLAGPVVILLNVA